MNKVMADCLLYTSGLYPNWDAANKMSVGLAEKLGYHFSHEYVVYKVKK